METTIPGEPLDPSSSVRPLRIIHTVSTLNHGGMESFVVRLAELQRNAGHEASILALWSGPLLAVARSRGIPVHVIDRSNLLARVADAARWMARQRPEIMHAHNPTSLQYAVLGRLLGEGLERVGLRGPVRVIMTDHHSHHRTPSSFEWRRVDAVVAVSASTVLVSSAAGKGRRMLVIENGVTLNVGESTRDKVCAELGLGPGLLALTVANLLPVKNHIALLEALARLRDQGVALTALWVGQGPERAPLEARARALDLGPDRLRFLGYRGDVPDLLRAADFFVLPSAAEGMPLAVMEAMGSGLPVVATAVGGIPEVIDDGVHGLLVPPHDPAALAAAMGRLIADPDLRRSLGASGFARMRDEFSFARTGQRYEALYADLLGLALQPRGRSTPRVPETSPASNPA